MVEHVSTYMQHGKKFYDDPLAFRALVDDTHDKVDHACLYCIFEVVG